MTRRMWALLSLLSTTVTGSSSTPPRLLPSSLPSLYLPPALSLEAYVKPSSSIPHWNEKILNFLRARRRQQKKENTILEASFIQSDFGVHQKRSLPDQQHPPPRAASAPRRSCSMRILSCGSSNKDSSSHARIPRSKSNNVLPVIDLARAISLISNSNRLDECETSIRVVAKSWLGSGRNPILETRLSATSFIEGLLEVSWASKDDEVLELAVSILAGLVTISEVNQQVVLNAASPQLEVFLRLLRHETLSSKAVVLVYLLKPKAKHMLSLDWMPLLLGILDNGDRANPLFSVQCSPISAALYLLDQLLVGFNEDRNVENARQFVALGGLSRLINRLEVGDDLEKQRCASLLATCVRADDSCRSFLAANINKASIIQLLLGNQLKSTGTAISLLSELVCLKRTTHMIEFLTGFKNDGCLNTMHVLMVYLQQAPVEQRPVAAAILLQLDLLGDPLQSSFYREEGIDAIIMGLERSLHNKKIQEQCSKALFLLGGHISFTGEAEEEAWLLKRAGLDYGQEDAFNCTDKRANGIERMEEEVKANESWLRKLAFVLLTSGNKRFLVALSNCIADGSPILARSCLITIAWLSWSLSSLYDANNILQSLVCSILAPRLLESLSYDKALEERVLASLSLLNFAQHPECLHKLLPVGKDTLSWLEDLARTAWTAKELLFLFQR